MKDIMLKTLLMGFAVSLAVNCSESTERPAPQTSVKQVANQENTATTKSKYVVWCDFLI